MADRSAAQVKQAALTELRARALLMLDAFERDQPGTRVGQLRQVVAGARSASAMRMILREVRAAASTLSPAGREELERELTERFGPGVSADEEREQAVVAAVRRHSVATGV